MRKIFCEKIARTRITGGEFTGETWGFFRETPLKKTFMNFLDFCLDKKIMMKAKECEQIERSGERNENSL